MQFGLLLLLLVGCGWLVVASWLLVGWLLVVVVATSPRIGPPPPEPSSKWPGRSRCQHGILRGCFAQKTQGTILTFFDVHGSCHIASKIPVAKWKLVKLRDFCLPCLFFFGDLSASKWHLVQSFLGGSIWQAGMYIYNIYIIYVRKCIYYMWIYIYTSVQPMFGVDNLVE